MTSNINTLFSETDLANVREGVRRYIRLMGLIHDPSPLVWDKWFTDEQDATGAVTSVVRAIKATSVYSGARKYVNVPLDPVSLALVDLTNLFLKGRTEAETSLNYRRNIALFHTIVEPTANLFRNLSHDQMLEHAQDIGQMVSNMIMNSSDHYGTYDDAIVMRALITKEVNDREQQRVAEAAAKRNKRKRKDPVDELFAVLGIDEEAFADI